MRCHHRGAPRVDPAVALGQLKLHLVRERDAVLHRELVERAGDRPLHAGPVVAPHPDDQGVVELAQLIDRVDDATDVVVRVLRVPGVHLHLAGVEGLQLVGHVVPGRERLVARGQLRVGRHDTELLLAGEGLFAQPVPSLVELALVLVGPVLRDVMGGVAAPGRVVDEERLVRLLGAHAVEPFDGPIRHRVGEVVRILRVVVALGGTDDLLVLRKARIPLARSSAQDPVEVVEPPAVRPAVQRPGRTLLAVGRQVPLAEARRAVAVLPQDPGQRHTIAGQRGGVAGEPARELPDRAEADEVVVPAREQRGPRRRAQRGHVEPVVAQATRGELRVAGCLYRAPERARVAEAGIVDEHHQHVRRPVRRGGMADEVPVGLGALERPVGHPRERRPADREHSAIWSVHRHSPLVVLVSSALVGPGVRSTGWSPAGPWLGAEDVGFGGRELVVGQRAGVVE